MTKGAPGTLFLHRFCGDEVYRVDRAEIITAQSESGTELYLDAWCDEGAICSLEDTAALGAQPHVTVSVVVESADLAQLVGRRYLVPAGYDDDADRWLASIYYCEHENLDNNEIEIVAMEPEGVRIRWTATTCDVNYYDGSKPETRVEVDAVFSITDPQ